MADSIPENWDIRCTYEYRKGWEAGSSFVFATMSHQQIEYCKKIEILKDTLHSISLGHFSTRYAERIAKKILKEVE